MTAEMRDFEIAVHDWFVGATGLETVWREQTAPQPPLPFASLKIISGPLKISPAVVTEKEIEDQPEGEEIEIKAMIPCSVSVSCQTYVGVPDSRNPEWDARTYAILAMTALEMPSVRSTFWQQGVSILEVGAVQNLDALVETEWESRANFDVTFGLVLTRAEYVGYIKTVHIKSESLRIDRDFIVGD